jgi:hypothetical protein
MGIEEIFSGAGHLFQTPSETPKDLGGIIAGGTLSKPDPKNI